MNYEKTVEELLENLFRQNWMDKQDWYESLETFYNYFPKEHLIKQLKEGENNGYSVEQQLQLIKSIFVK